MKIWPINAMNWHKVLDFLILTTQIAIKSCYPITRRQNFRLVHMKEIVYNILKCILKCAILNISTI